MPSLVLVVLLPLTCRCLSLAGIDRLRHGYISGIGGVMPSGNVHWIDNGGIYSRRKTSSRINRGWIRLTAFSLWTFGDFLHEKRHRSPDFVLWMQGGGNESPTKGDTGHAETTKNADANEECSRNEINAGVSEKSEKTDEELDPNAKLNAIIAVGWTMSTPRPSIPFLFCVVLKHCIDTLSTNVVMGLYILGFGKEIERGREGFGYCKEKYHR